MVGIRRSWGLLLPTSPTRSPSWRGRGWSTRRREKRDCHDKLEQERQAGIQALKKLEKQKRDLERLQQESANIAR
jgi:hypothetical protein